ncbi:MAG: TIGR03545 family protein [candidate division KSB1 bacterium]|nr:TIGR03545 family protein [candidate division KSB1 bacterium]
MRKKALAIVAILVVAFLVWLYVRRNALVDSAIEGSGSRLVGAKVEIDGVSLDFLRLKLGFDRLQVTNPNDTWHNWIELGSSGVQLEWRPLLWNRYVVREFYVREIRLNSPRQTDGALPGAKPRPAGPSLTDRARRALQAKLEETPIPDLARFAQRKIDVDSLIRVLGLTTPDSVQQLLTQLQTTAEDLRTRLVALDPRDELDRVKGLVEPIRPAEIRSLQELTDALQRVQQARTTLQSYRLRFDSTRTFVRARVDHASRQIQRVDDWARADLTRLRSSVGLPSFDATEVAQMLFGPATVEKALGALRVVELAREAMPYVAKAQAFARAGKVQRPPRGKGVNVSFPVTEKWPKWLVRRVEVSAVSSRTDTSRAWFVAGELRNLNSDPRFLGKPTTVQLKGRVPQGTRFELNGLLDHTSDTPLDQFDLRLTSLGLGGVEFPKSRYFPTGLELNQANATLEFELRGEHLELSMLVRCPEAAFVFPSDDPRDRLAEAFQRLFSDIRNLDLEARIAGPIDHLSLHVRSNLDVLLSHQLRALVGEQIALAQSQLEARVQRVADEQRRRLLSWYESNLKPIVDKIEEYRALFEQRDQLLEAKKQELERRIEEEKQRQKSELEKAARRKLEDLLRKRP